MPAGKRSKLTDTVIQKVCEARSIGATYKIAASYAGISETVIMAWLAKGRDIQAAIDKGETPELTPFERKVMEFVRKITEADTADDINLLQVIDKAAARDPDWAEKRLRWKHRGDFTLSVPIEHSGPGGGAIPVAQITVDEWKAQQAARREQAGNITDTFAGTDE